MRKARFLAAALCAAVLMCGFATPAHAGGGDDTGGSNLWEGLDSAVTAPVPSPEPEQKPFTPSGQGTVVDNATDAEGKEFFTITTAEEAVFYLVIDRQRNGENVYFLNAVTLADLAALAEANGEPPAPEPTPVPEPAPEPAPTPEPEPEAKGGAAWYFKIYRPKHQQAAAPEDDYDEAPYDGPEDYGDGPPWDEDDPNDGEPEE